MFLERKIQMKNLIIEQLKKVYDPEIAVNVYDLGLIYDIDIDHFPKVTITHTLTSAWCGFADEIIVMIEKACKDAGAETVDVITTFDPPFTMDSVPEETKLMLGWI
jgi:metal-sulfur cluster biosynthetic enzyme